MPLVPESGYLAEKFRGVFFVMRDGEKRVSCGISHAALVDFAARQNFSEKSDEEIYRTFRTIIQDFASRKYYDGSFEADGSVLVKSADLRSVR